MSESSAIVYNDLASLGRLKAQSTEKPKEALQEAAKQFEALFVSMMLKAMRDTLPEDGMFGSNSMKNYQEMFDQQLSLDLSRNSGMGLSDLIARQLSAGIPNSINTDAAAEPAADPQGSAAFVAALDAYNVSAVPAVSPEQKR